MTISEKYLARSEKCTFFRKSAAFSAVFPCACRALIRSQRHSHKLQVPDGRTQFLVIPGCWYYWWTLSGSLSFGTDSSSGAAQKQTCLMSDGHFPAGHSYQTRRLYTVKFTVQPCPTCAHGMIVVVPHFYLISGHMTTWPANQTEVSPF